MTHLVSPLPPPSRTACENIAFARSATLVVPSVIYFQMLNVVFGKEKLQFEPTVFHYAMDTFESRKLNQTEWLVPYYA